VSKDERTYGRVAAQYDEWTRLESQRPERDHLRRSDPALNPVTTDSTDMSRLVFTAIGVGIGLILLALAAYAFVTAASWADVGRESATVGYILVGIFLSIAGLGGIIATWNHNFRVLTRPPEHH
jgi:hypothetical protein